MTKKQIYQTNIQIQYMTAAVIHACRIQNYEKVLRLFTDIVQMLMQVLEAVFSDLDYYNQEMELVNPEGIELSLQDIMTAQENKDYILLADLLELRLVPFIQTLQEAIRVYENIGVDAALWKKNLAALEQRNPQLNKLLLAYHKKYEAENTAGTWQGTHHLEATNSGAYTMAGRDERGMYYYHSNVNPREEAMELAQHYYTTDAAEYIIWGLGLGYHIQELYQLDDGISMQIFESDLDVIYHCLMAVDLTNLFENKNFSLQYDPEFKEIISVLGKTSGVFVIHNPSLRHISDVGIREKMEMFFIRDSGKRNVEILFESNSRENLKNFDGYIDELYPEFSGKRAVIVAAGPSLDKNVKLLKEKPEDMLILATGTVFRKLLGLGIEVDYVIVTDANHRIYSQMAGLEEQRVPMLYLSTAYKGFSANYKGKKYVICQRGYDKAESKAAEQGWQLYETGGSVSTTALDVCIRLGCKEIAFIGLDLAYTDNLAHAEGTSRRAAAEAGDLKQMPAVGGGTVPVSRLFMIYNTWIQKRVKDKDVTMSVIDATEGGVMIPGLKSMTLKEYMKG